MRDTIISILPGQFVRFALTGGIAAAVNILSRIALSQIVNYTAAIAGAFVIGMSMGYVLMKIYVFEKSGRAANREYVRFGFVNLFAFVQVWFVSVALARFIFPGIGFYFHQETTAHMIGVLSPVVTSYFLHKYFTFRKIR